MPESDERKLLWRERLEDLRSENQSAVKLINENKGRIISGTFKDACEEYKSHVIKWNAVFRALEGRGTMPLSVNQEGAFYAHRFPERLEPALVKEIAEIKRLAGQI